MVYLEKMVIFHGYVSLPEGTSSGKMIFEWPIIDWGSQGNPCLVADVAHVQMAMTQNLCKNQRWVSIGREHLQENPLIGLFFDIFCRLSGFPLDFPWNQSINPLIGPTFSGWCPSPRLLACASFAIGANVVLGTENGNRFEVVEL